MAIRQSWGKCYVCRHNYKGEELGRVFLPLSDHGSNIREAQVICQACWQAMFDSLQAMGREDVLLLHGF